MHPLIAVLGPTGSGKSALGLALAEELAGEIVNCDSVQVHSGLNVGSAKTPMEQRRAIPHHMLDVIPAEGDLTAGAYAREARAILDLLRRRGTLPILVGGTGFYLRALLDGLSPAPERDPDLRSRLARLETRRPGVLYRFLIKHDPVAAGRIHRNDLQKVTRAVEMTVSTGRAASEVQRSERMALVGFRVLKLGLAPRREDLRRNIDARTVRIFASGLIEETRSLLDDGCPPHAKALQSLGYRQAVKLLSGKTTTAEAIAECQLKTRQYAKRQMTWFRRDAGIDWLSGFGTDLSLQRDAIELARHWLSGRLLSAKGKRLSVFEQHLSI
jgi:tRNA dimethylallyltransferase